MNWVGGSRSRLVVKNDSKKQREFFEKRKMQQKLRTMGVALPAASPGANAGSMDLVTLFVVNQIAAKKEIRDAPEAGLPGSAKGPKRRGRGPVVLPMSPCSPSQLGLAESQPRYSAQGAGQRMNVIPQGFKFHQLSPVLESAFSDNSASDYLPPAADPLSSFSSASSASSGQGIFPLQIGLQQGSLNEPQPGPLCSSPAWDPSGLDQTKFQRFSLTRGVTHNKPRSAASNQPLYQWETPTAAQILFGKPDSSETAVRDHASQQGRLSFNRPVDKEPMLDMSDTEQQCKEGVFRGFCNEEHERDGRPKSKIYLRKETPNKSATSLAAPDPERGVELSSSTYTNLSPGSGHNTGPVNSCEPLPSYSFREGYLSSDSNDEEECCQLCLNSPASSCINQACSVKGGLQGEAHQRHSQPSPPSPSSPPVKAKGNLSEEQNTVYKDVCLHTACIGSSTAQCLTQTQSCGLCKCKKMLRETREAGTQTVLEVETCDASIQCDRSVNDTEFSLCLPPVDVPVQLPATGRQRDTAAEPNNQQALSGKRSGGMGMATSNTSKDYTLSGSPDSRETLD